MILAKFAATISGYAFGSILRGELLLWWKIEVGLKELNEFFSKLVLLRSGNLDRHLGLGFEPKYNQLQCGGQRTGTRLRNNKNLTGIGQTLLNEDSRRPTMDAGLILYNCRCFKHLIQLRVDRLHLWISVAPPLPLAPAHEMEF